MASASDSRDTLVIAVSLRVPLAGLAFELRDAFLADLPPFDAWDLPAFGAAASAWAKLGASPAARDRKSVV